MCEEQYGQNIPPDCTYTCVYSRFYLFFANMAAVIKVFSRIVAVHVNIPILLSLHVNMSICKEQSSENVGSEAKTAVLT